MIFFKEGKNSKLNTLLNTLPFVKKYMQNNESPESVEIQGFFMELLGGFEPPTSSLPRMRSTD